VIATDASPPMLELARETAPGVEDLRILALPDDPIPAADAVVGVGHPLNYLPDEAAIDRALVAMANALRAGGILATDLCDLEWAAARVGVPASGRVGDDWAIVMVPEIPAPNRYIRQMAFFVKNDDGTWRRDDERHDNVLVDTTLVPALLAEHGVEATVGAAFGTEQNPIGLRTIVGRRVD